MDQSILKELYIEKEMSQREVGAELGCSQSTVRYYLKKFGIRRNQSNPVTDTSPKCCPSCGEIKPRTEFYKAVKRGKRVHGSWCKKCMKRQVLERQRKNKERYVKQKGGCCQAVIDGRLCGFNTYYGALEFHHVDPNEKDSKISSLTRRADSPEVQAELAKCVLVCSNCHRMIHAGVIDCPTLA